MRLLDLFERFHNYIGVNSIKDRKLWIDQVWDLLQTAYAPIGGIKGNGFSSKEELINNIPFWKLYIRDGKVKVAVFYKDKQGRKTVAIAGDGSNDTSELINGIFRASLGVSYGEKSGPALGRMMKVVDFDTLSRFLLYPDDLETILKEPIIPIEKYDYDNLSIMDKRTYDRYPELHPYMYVRELGGENHLKVAMGTPNLPILG